MKKVSKIAAILVLLYSIGLVGTNDLQHEQQQFLTYCEHVFGPLPIWPDYNNVGVDACTEEDS